jgi:capsular exopolysaccharide synthesis family protein
VDKQKAGYPGMGELMERFKFLRNSLLLSSPGNPPKTVLVTSGSEREGKSFVAANFASSYAQLGKRVLLIDADLRRPSVHRFFGMQNKVGLTNVIIGQTKLNNGCIQQTTVPNLFVLPSGSKSPSPAELLSSKAMVALVKQCAQHFDMIVLDSAPLFPVVDSHALGMQADASLLVVRSDSTKGPAVKSALELLSRAQSKVAGIILNDIDLMDFAQSYYYRHYSYSYAPNSYQDQTRA